jgi:hypothetical protein
MLPLSRSAVVRRLGLLGIMPATGRRGFSDPAPPLAQRRAAFDSLSRDEAHDGASPSMSAMSPCVAPGRCGEHGLHVLAARKDGERGLGLICCPR